jgi:hypothetical protein
MQKILSATSGHSTRFLAANGQQKLKLKSNKQNE